VLVESETILVSPSREDRERAVLPDLGVVPQVPEAKGPGAGKATAAALEVEEDCEVLVDLASAFSQACEFNDWPTLAGR